MSSLQDCETSGIVIKLVHMILIPSSWQTLEEMEVHVVYMYLRSKLQLGTQQILYVEAVHFVWVEFCPLLNFFCKTTLLLHH